MNNISFQHRTNLPPIPPLPPSLKKRSSSIQEQQASLPPLPPPPPESNTMNAPSQLQKTSLHRVKEVKPNWHNEFQIHSTRTPLQHHKAREEEPKFAALAYKKNIPNRNWKMERQEALRQLENLFHRKASKIPPSRQRQLLRIFRRLFAI